MVVNITRGFGVPLYLLLEIYVMPCLSPMNNQNGSEKTSRGSCLVFCSDTVVAPVYRRISLLWCDRPPIECSKRWNHIRRLGGARSGQARSVMVTDTDGSWRNKMLDNSSTLWRGNVLNDGPGQSKPVRMLLLFWHTLDIMPSLLDSSEGDPFFSYTVMFGWGIGLV